MIVDWSSVSYGKNRLKDIQFHHRQIFTVIVSRRLIKEFEAKSVSTLISECREIL